VLFDWQPETRRAIQARQPPRGSKHAMPKSLQTRFEEIESRYKLIADNLVDAIWVMDADSLTYDFITHSVEKISGYAPGDYSGLDLRQMTSPDSYLDLKAALEEERLLCQQGVSRKRIMELEMIHKQGHPYWIEITAKMFKDEDGRLKVAGISRDIGKRKQAEQERERLIRELGLALAEKESLLKENRILRGLLPICAGCRRIRDEQGRWWPLEAYVRAHTGAEFTHTICDQCQQVYYGNLKGPQ
jgi:PAS domain S-box-containing protein